MNLAKSSRLFLSDNIWHPVTSFGSPVFYIFTAIILLKASFFISARILLVLLTVEVCCWAIKFFYRKERPRPQRRDTFLENMDANSFPSIHTARISALAFLANIFYPGALLFFLGIGMIAGVGYSRIYLKKHDIKDVFGGFFIGIFIAALSLTIR